MGMKLDRWTEFCLSLEDQQLFRAFASPDHEASIIKDVPIGAFEQTRPILKRLRKLTGRRTYIMYRGPRNRYHGQSCTWRQDAVSFSVYWRSEPVMMQRMPNQRTFKYGGPPQWYLWVLSPTLQKKTTP